MKLLKKKLTLVALSGVLAGCYGPDAPDFSGYVNGEFIYLSHSATERVEDILVTRGSRVSRGQELVVMESFTVENSRDVARKNYEAELATLRNLQSGERPEELAITRSQLERATAAARLAKNQMERYQKLYATQVISGAEWDNVKQDYAQKQAQVKELTSQLKAQKLPARSQQLKNQQSRVEQAKLQLDKARWDSQQNTIVAPQDALVYDIIYRRGERPGAGRPIISLLPPENIKVRFFVPEKRLGEVSVGQKVSFTCDGCQNAITGSINYISPQAEYAPPVIYSTSRREKLLFLVEAVPEQASISLLKPGQPVDVRLAAHE
ncbi:HlyD family efflux transporter periplasmic adaptor subunit [Enterobacterales bacterium BIT-L3]|uniref:HlyD family efflux transporter periplasmic adaptor subunit n=3 Tax=Enterobacteriaceae TaxID=543 RepID=A0A8K0V094_9ENTR|nr:HlyD family efflux transporter periplasmic adaptor subunit [Tenebrionibacter intestinalis]MBV5095271.1 HlyD family efflux transporter periplasmic adaptor subunit [Tenebrionicola larvae]